jgi:hypothetical protein
MIAVRISRRRPGHARTSSASSAAALGVNRARGSGRSRDRSNPVFARTERHNHAAFGGLREGETKQCEPVFPLGRSGAVTPKDSTFCAALGAKCVAFCVALVGELQPELRATTGPT